jgi:hypothetical protein
MQSSDVPASNPLGPRDFGGILDETVRIYRRGFLRLITVSVISAGLSLLLAYLIFSLGLIGPWDEVFAELQSIGDAAAADQAFERIGEIFLQDLPSLIAAVLVGTVVSLTITLVAWGAYVYVVGGHYTRGAVALEDAFSFGVRRLLPLFGVTLLMVLIFIGGMFVLLIAPILLSVLVPPVVLLAVFGFFGGIALAVYAFVRWAFVFPAVLIEGAGPVDALARSWRLVQDNWWRVFGIIAVVFLALGILSAAVAAADPFAPAADEITFIPSPLALLWSIVTGPIQAIVFTLLYLDLRARKEGFDAGDLARSLGLAGNASPGSPA